MAIVDEGAQAARELQVLSELSSLELNVETLIKEVDLLQNKLSDVLRQEPVGEEKGTPQLNFVPLANRIRGSRLKIEEVIAWLTRMRDRLEI